MILSVLQKIHFVPKKTNLEFTQPLPANLHLLFLPILSLFETTIHGQAMTLVITKPLLQRISSSSQFEPVGSLE
jgi:hypothetical protein